MTRPRLRVLDAELAACRLEPDAAIPQWAQTGQFCSVTRTGHELSIVCEVTDIPAQQRAEPGWRAIEAEGPLDFSLVGVLTGLLGPLAAAGISVMAISTFDTDYVLVKQDTLERACETLRHAGYEFTHKT